MGAIPLNNHRKVVLTAILFLLFIIVVVHATQVKTFQVNPLLDQKMQFDLDRGFRLTGSFSVEGGNNDIDFKVIDPVGNTIIDLGRVTGETSFQFLTEQDGNYTAVFGNSFSMLTSRTVTISYDVRHIFLGLDLLDLLSIIALSLSIGFVLAGVLYIRSRKRR